MTEQKPKTRPIIKKRDPKKVTNSGIFDNLRRIPQAHPVEEFLPPSERTTDSPHSPTHPNPSQLNPTHPVVAQPNPPQPKPLRTDELPVSEAIAPFRDFNRRANSLERDAMPAGLFPGTSKKLYDALYLRTRGAILPTRRIQATKRQLMEWSGIRSKNTIAVNLQMLVSSGLVEKSLEIGDHEGSVYEIKLPEELGGPDPSHPIPTQPDPTQKLGGVPTQKLGWDGSGNPYDNKSFSASAKTSSKTLSNRDDETVLRDLVEAEREATGKESPPQAWAELIGLLATELKKASARTNVSSAPAFLAEHLRRRLSPKPPSDQTGGSRTENTATARLDTLGDPNKRLTAEEIAEQVRLLRELLDGGYTLDQAEEQFGGSFHAEDWRTIKSELSEAENKNPSARRLAPDA